ncbi:hypothetical protein B0H63DRAFT_121685 [Podospora didyma]|uniref:SET domain-containing protein n=1 Tax=Podospora didyma TaxID=330526 RepID=A0AAE0U4N1_9PEZI|nr:hypothetical protein B0H63DRAFT_121685 [Podospora didyma]
MRVISLLSLASCAGAIRHQVSLQSSSSPDSCLWRPPPPRLACGIDEIEVSSKARVKSASKSPPPSKWEGPRGCVEQYCIFSNQGFEGGRGIVAVTTNANIQNLKALEKKGSAASTAQPASSSGNRPAYYIAKVPGKGLGLISNTTLHRGDVLMKHTPAVLIHRTFFETIHPATQAPLLKTAISHLPSALRKAFFSQMGHFGDQAHKINDILATNSFQMNLGGHDGHHYGNFPEVSRFNHDCRPNVAFYLGGGGADDLTHTTTVVRDVQPGEELSISYLDSFAPCEERQQRTFEAWGFSCSCSQCALSKGQVKKSDKRLKEIKEIEVKLSDFSGRVTGAILKKLAKLYDEERLDANRAGGLTLIALNYNMLGDEKNAKRYARLAREALVIENGPGAGDVSAMEELERDPRGHFTWRGRVGR